ncbi:HAD family hydrolase [Lentzea terrae]|uniref:HAD family hydrolase n=1 Tax=Lentzea terrae TaxID=2200761 RepID=UPI00130029FC|nr:HAD hydrolase family protein [Lentzea terrae]
MQWRWTWTGRIACGGPPGEEVLAAVRDARAGGIRVLLVSGRILAELEAEFPGLAGEFDAVVAENGAVLALSGVVRPLARPVDPQLLRWLTERGVAVRRGMVILALQASAAHLALDAVQDLRLDAQLVRNRGELMVLPAGVTKGGGLVDALSELGVSPHSAIAVGDAENDHALLEAAELGVAVSNAVDSLVAHADLVLPAPNGVGWRRCSPARCSAAPSWPSPAAGGSTSESTARAGRSPSQRRRRPC